ncbi:von Willebrand factor D and EGF domain-containing protein-like [Crassostrea virginica]
MNESAGYKACLGVPNVYPENAIADCFADIQLTNSTFWAPLSREGLKTRCLKEISQNNTLQNTVENNGVSVVDNILSITCPFECNERGTCRNGTCICYDDYGAADCSINLNDPPIVNGVNLDSGGLCDTRHCSEFIVEGDLFLDRSTLTCRMQRFEIEYHGQLTYLETVDVEADHNSISDVICPFPKHQEGRSADPFFVSGYKIAMSNNGIKFSESHFVYILDSTCQDTMNVSGEIKFVLKDGYCFINGRCISDGTQDSTNIYSVCRYKSDLFNWSKRM